MKLAYQKQADFNEPPSKWKSRPVIWVQLFHENRGVAALALIDSGADCSVFHTSLAQALGIDYTKGRRTDGVGVSTTPIDLYFHPVQVKVRGDDTVIDMEAAFTESERVGAILGQRDFFEHYKITFERYKERIELTPAKK
jgi:hypothetical protein